MTLRPGISTDIWEGRAVVGVPSHIQQLARRAQRVLHNIESLQDIYLMDCLRLRRERMPPRYFYRLDVNWHLRFDWEEGRCFEVALVERSRR